MGIQTLVAAQSDGWVRSTLQHLRRMLGLRLRLVVAVVLVTVAAEADVAADLMTNQNVDPRIARYSFADFWKYVGSLHHKQRYKYLLVVIRIIFLIPVGSAECERIFSLMNRILDSAPTISHRNLVRRMRVKYLSPKEPPLEWFDPAIDKFLTRRRHTGDL